MTTITIPAKMSNSGSIYDIASDCYDREIKLRQGTKFAVVLASYYGDHYTTHKTAESAALKSESTDESHTIIDAEGNCYEVEQSYSCPRLVPTGDNV